MKNWLRGKGKGEDERQRDLTVDDLVSLGRLEEARMELEHQLRSGPRHHHLKVKLADVLLAMRRPSEALEIYEGAAQGYAADGFHDKSRAVLHKMLKVAPNHEKAVLGLEQLERAKEREHRRQIVMRHLSHAGEGDRAIDAFRINQFWKGLSRSSVLEALDIRSLSRLFESFELRRLPEGTQIADRGDSLQELFLVAGGGVEAIEKRADGPPVVLRTYESGDVFGEGSLLEHHPWVAVHRARDTCHALCLTRDGLAKALVGASDPRAFLDALRAQRHDASLTAMVRTAREP
jgi:tetratricopeptide (TPR) repeat protein